MSYLEIGEEMQLPAHTWSALLVADGPADSESTFSICNRQLGNLRLYVGWTIWSSIRWQRVKIRRRAQRTGVTCMLRADPEFMSLVLGISTRALWLKDRE